MNILTSSGYIDIADATPGTEVVYYDLQTGERLINEIVAIEKWDKEKRYKLWLLQKNTQVLLEQV